MYNLSLCRAGYGVRGSAVGLEEISGRLSGFRQKEITPDFPARISGVIEIYSVTGTVM